jgi:hypothetical protein
MWRAVLSHQNQACAVGQLDNDIGSTASLLQVQYQCRWWYYVRPIPCRPHPNTISSALPLSFLQLLHLPLFFSIAASRSSFALFQLLHCLPGPRIGWFSSPSNIKYVILRRQLFNPNPDGRGHLWLPQLRETIQYNKMTGSKYNYFFVYSAYPHKTTYNYCLLKFIIKAMLF